MAAIVESIIQNQLLDRRKRLETAIVDLGGHSELHHLLQEVDSALNRYERGEYGICQVCKGEIEADRLIANPLTQFCLGDLSPREQQVLQKDLELAALIQKGLLPKTEINLKTWSSSYRYQPIGLVSGDYCDLINGDNGESYFILGDVSGKGVAASMLMAQLHAMFRSLIPVKLPLVELVARVSSIFCESTMPMHFATLVCGKLSANGEVEICNAGHLPPLLMQGEKLITIEATGLPIGMFNDEKFTAIKVELAVNDTLLLYTDGLTEAENRAGEDYGNERLGQLLGKHCTAPVDTLIGTIIDDLQTFQSGSPASDDLTVLALRRVG